MRVSATESESDGRSLEMFLRWGKKDGDRFDMRLERECGVQDDTKVAYLRGWADGAPVNI